MIKRYSIIIAIIFVTTFRTYAQDLFSMKELSVIEFMQNYSIFDKIESELQRYIQDINERIGINKYNNEYIEEIELDNFRYIYEFWTLPQEVHTV